MSAFTIHECACCGHAAHPPRILCPRCGCQEWRAVAAATGTAEEVTETAGVRLAAVRTDRGPRVIARAAQGLRPGDRVALTAPGGVASAQPER
jgi:uncharacterized OB-fold protein